MITDLLASYGGVLGVVGYLLTLIAEDFLGRKKPLGAPSLLKFVPAVINYLLSFFRKEAPPMTIQNQTAAVAKETNDVILLVLALARDYKTGVKTGDMVGKEVGLLMTAFQDSDQIMVEMRSNPAAWYRTVLGGVGELISIFVGPTLTVTATPVVILPK